ncbi:hypothetical protein BDR22DRAFT_233151 [Usnea florida]
MAVVTGGIKINIVRTHREIPEGSSYLPLKANCQRRQRHSQEDAMEGTLYAEGVVQAALRTESTRSLCRGHQAWNVWLLLTLMPRRLLDYSFSRAFNAIKHARLFKAQRKNK